MKNAMKEYISVCTDTEVISCHSEVIRELKKRSIIRTKNVVGEIGEYLAINYYSNTKGLPNLQLAPPGTQNIAVISDTQNHKYYEGRLRTVDSVSWIDSN
jgi:hypothetical protein